MSREIKVDGNGNRVAGRDYYENYSKPCCRCEIRHVMGERTVCNHCTRHEQAEKGKFYFLLFLAAVIFIGFELHKWREGQGLGELFDNMLLAVMLVFFGWFAAQWVRIWIFRRW